MSDYARVCIGVCLFAGVQYSLELLVNQVMVLGLVFFFWSFGFGIEDLRFSVCGLGITES